MTDNERGATRRVFIGGVLLIAGGAVMLAPSAGALARRMPAQPRARRVVVAFHSDQLYLDHSGKAEPYMPPAGLRSLDGLDEDALRHLVYHL